jgi:hypothetical protein
VIGQSEVEFRKVFEDGACGSGKQMPARRNEHYHQDFGIPLRELLDVGDGIEAEH